MQAGSPTRGERLAFLLLATLVLAYVIIRAVLVPVVHDEAMTFFLYVETGDLLPFRAHWDAGNHLLSTALGWACWSCFGFHAWALRLPNLLAFVLYAAYAWRWGTRLQDPLVRWSLMAALLLMPFQLDFFSLFRGYGLAMAFWSMALYHLFALLEKPTTKALVLTLSATALATFSSLNLLSLWAAILALSLLVVFQRRTTPRRIGTRAIAWLVLGAVPFLFATAYTLELSKKGALYYGNQDGVILGTLRTLGMALFDQNGAALPLLVLLLLIAATGLALRARLKKDRSFTAWVLLVGSGLLWADGLGRILLFHWNGTPFPEDRTAMHWVPLFVLLLAFAMDHCARAMPHWKWTALLLLAFPLRTLATLNLSTTSYWPEQAIPDAIFRAAEQEQANALERLTIGAYHQMPACWGFGTRERGLELRLNAVDFNNFPNGGEDLLLMDPAQRGVPEGYRAVAVGQSGRVALLRNERAPTRTLLLDSTFTGLPSDAEFRELWAPAIASVRGRSFFVELEMALHTVQEPWTGDVVVEVNGDDMPQYYEHALVQFMRHPARSDSVHTVRHIPTVPQAAQRVVVYLWNPAHRTGTCTGRLRVYTSGNPKQAMDTP